VYIYIYICICNLWYICKLEWHGEASITEKKVNSVEVQKQINLNNIERKICQKLISMTKVRKCMSWHFSTKEATLLYKCVTVSFILFREVRLWTEQYFMTSKLAKTRYNVGRIFVQFFAQKLNLTICILGYIHIWFFKQRQENN
jgi:hypothetical protein